MFDGHPNLHRRHGLLSPYVLKLLFGVFLMFTVVYFYSDRSQNMQLLQLKSNEADTCAQKSDSLSAQLQVMYEHKSRLEKLLAEKQMSSARTIHDLEKQLKAASEKADSESNSALDCQSKVSSLQSQLNSLKEEKLHDDGQVQEELTKAKDDLSNAHRKLADLEKAKNTASEDVNTLSAQVKQLQAEVEQCASNDHNIEANAAVKRDERSNVLDNQLVEHPDGGRPQQLPDSKLAPSPAIAVPLNASPPTTTAKVYVHNDSVVFDRPDGGALPRPKVVEPAGADGGHIRPPGEEEGVMAAPDVSNPRDKVVFDRAPAGGSLAEVANNEGPGVRRLKQPDDGEEAVGAVPKNGEEEVAVGAAPKNDAAEADANEQEDGPQELKEGNAAHPDDTDYKDDEEKSDNAKEDGHGA